MSAEKRRFSYPEEIETPPGAEGWEEMYPYYFLPHTETDKEDFYFLDVVHIPEPIPPFDAFSPESWLRHIGQYNSRVFMLPPALGLKGFFYRGYLYWSPKEITDPKEIEKRVPLFMKRAGYYFDHWNEIYDKWIKKVENLLERTRQITIEDLPEMEDESVIFEAKGLDKGFHLQTGYRNLLNLNDELWQYHFEMLNLGYASYVLFVDFCTKAFPGIELPTATKMVSGVDFLMYRPVEELKRLAKLAVEWGLADIVKKEYSPEEMIEELEKSEKGRTFSKEIEKSKEWFYYRTGKGGHAYHYTHAWIEDLSVPFRNLRDFVLKIEKGESIERPKEKLIEERDRITEEYLGLLKTDEDKNMFRLLLDRVRAAYIYVEDHMWYCENIFQTLFYERIRKIGKILVDQDFLDDPEDIFYINRFELEMVLWDVAYTWASGGRKSFGQIKWRKTVDKRRKIMEALRKAPTPPPFFYQAPDKITEPLTIMLWGVTTEKVKQAIKPGDLKPEEMKELQGIAASSGVEEGSARVIMRPSELEQVQMDEILVCPSTEPTWASAFGRIKAIVTNQGGIMSHAAIACREYGIPSVSNTTIGTEAIKTGDLIKVDGDAGTVTILERAS
jgi:pyruvate,water dikinase